MMERGGKWEQDGGEESVGCRGRSVVGEGEEVWKVKGVESGGEGGGERGVKKEKRRGGMVKSPTP